MCDIDRKRSEDVADMVRATLGTRPAVHTDFKDMLEKEKGINAIDKHNLVI